MKIFLIHVESKGTFLIEGKFCQAIDGILKIVQSDNRKVEIYNACFWREFESRSDAEAALQMVKGL